MTHENVKELLAGSQEVGGSNRPRQSQSVWIFWHCTARLASQNPADRCFFARGLLPVGSSTVREL